MVSQKSKPDFTPVKKEFEEFTSIRLIKSTKNLIEKLFWFIIAIAGTIYIADLFINQVKYWNENPILVTKGSKSLTEVKAPAVTFCHQGLQKYALAERLANHIDPKKTAPTDVLKIRSEAIKAQTYKIQHGTHTPVDEFCYLELVNGYWINGEDKSKYTYDCLNFGRDIYLVNMRYNLRPDLLNQLVFEYIAEKRMWNLTQAIQDLQRSVKYLASPINDISLIKPGVNPMLDYIKDHIKGSFQFHEGK